MRKIGKTVMLIGRTLGVIIDADAPFDPAFWMPPKSGRITKVIVHVGGIAATTLIESGHITLRSTSFGGIEIQAPFQGIGLETVPRVAKKPWVTEVDVKVVSGVPIYLFYYYNVLPTTPELTVYVELSA